MFCTICSAIIDSQTDTMIEIATTAQATVLLKSPVKWPMISPKPVGPSSSGIRIAKMGTAIQPDLGPLGRLAKYPPINPLPSKPTTQSKPARTAMISVVNSVTLPAHIANVDRAFAFHPRHASEGWHLSSCGGAPERKERSQPALA
ncbi:MULTISPECIES: hypothetical protein [unclassified Sphingobium]|uniref:hypothetical protein n=1 Tax=unclassified Sphingobium TaxID=2611147 RepID=UPI0035A6DDF9